MYSLAKLFNNLDSSSYWFSDWYPTTSKFYTGISKPIEMNLAGYGKDNIEVRIEGDALRVSATKEGKTDISRTFLLSKEVDKSKITSEYRDGMLYINLTNKQQMEQYNRVIEIT